MTVFLGILLVTTIFLFLYLMSIFLVARAIDRDAFESNTFDSKYLYTKFIGNCDHYRILGNILRLLFYITIIIYIIPAELIGLLFKGISYLIWKELPECFK